MKLQIARYASYRVIEPASLVVTWQELATMLSDVRVTGCNPCPGKQCPAKFGVAWSPVVIEGSRNSANVKAVTAEVFDLDSISDEALQALEQRLDGLQYILCSTHSHEPPRNNCLHLVLALCRDITSAEHTIVRAALRHHFEIPSDELAGRDAARIYFLPSRASEAAPFLFRNRAGYPVAVDEALNPDRVI